MTDDARRLRGLLSAVCVMLMPLAACATGMQEEPSVPAPPECMTQECMTQECVAQEGNLDAGASLREAAGSYRLTLAAETRDGSRHATTGTLHLEMNPPALRRLSADGAAADDSVSVPLYGWAAIDLRPVGALEIGDLGSRDRLSPGVLVLEQRPAFAAPVAITLRLGSIANRRTGATAFDGGYTALHVTRLEESGGFSGTWISGVQAKRIEGHFCAAPIPADERPADERPADQRPADQRPADQRR